MADKQDTPDQHGDVGLKNLWRFMGYSLPYWKWLAGGFVTGLVRMVLPLYMPLFVKNVIDDVVSPYAGGELAADAALDVFWGMIPLLAGIIAVHAFVTMGRFYLPQVAANNAIRDIRFFLFRHLQRLSLAFHTMRPSGTIVARVMSDVGVAQDAFDMILIRTSQMLLEALAIAAYLIWRDPLWALISFATLPIFVVTIRLLKRPIRRASRMQRETVARMSGHMQERMAMIREVQSFTAEAHEQRQIRGEAELLKQHTLRQQWLHGILVAVSEITRIVGLVIVLGFGVYRVLAGHATIGDVTAFYLYVGMLLAPVQALSAVYARMQVAAVAADRIFEFLDSTPEIQDAPGAADIRMNRPPTVKFENVSFAYPADHPIIVLKNITFEAQPGQRVALVGESGSGKSTLISLLPRFYDVDTGRVLIDGKDVREVTVRPLRQSIGIVPQEPVLFSGTIRENILYGKRNATEQEVRAAAVAANAETFILEQPDGYETLLGERGAGLSGGQIQRIAIARAFLKDPAILILDEATSNLDAISEGLVLEALDRLAEGRTTFIIAHRLSTARSADLIIVTDSGTIAEMGSHQELLARGGIYRNLWDRQIGGLPATAK